MQFPGIGLHSQHGKQKRTKARSQEAEEKENRLASQPASSPQPAHSSQTRLEWAIQLIEQALTAIRLFQSFGAIVAGTVSFNYVSNQSRAYMEAELRIRKSYP